MTMLGGKSDGGYSEAPTQAQQPVNTQPDKQDEETNDLPF